MMSRLHHTDRGADLGGLARVLGHDAEVNERLGVAVVALEGALQR